MSRSKLATRHDASVASVDKPEMFVLVQTKPSLQVLAVADDFDRLEVERQAMLDAPWDQDEDGQRELSILEALHLG